MNQTTHRFSLLCTLALVIATWLTGVSGRYVDIDSNAASIPHAAPHAAPQAAFHRNNVKVKIELTSESDVDSASGTCTELNPTTGHCPAINNKVICVDGEPFQFFCGMALYSAGLGDPMHGMGTTECAKACAANPECKGMDVNWEERICYLKSAYVPVPIRSQYDTNCAVPLNRGSDESFAKRRGSYQRMEM